MKQLFVLNFLFVCLFVFGYSEINQNSVMIEEEIEKCKGSALDRKRALDEEKDHFQKAAYAVLDMLNRD